jgi:hypothetical protein
VVDQILINNLMLPAATAGSGTSTSTATILDTAYGCASNPALAVNSTTTEFSAAVGGTCSTTSGVFTIGSASSATTISAAGFPVTVTFAPQLGGTRAATLMVTDTVNGGFGDLAVSGYGNATAQTINFTPPTTPAVKGQQVQLTASATSGLPITFSVDASSTATGSISNATTSAKGVTTATLTLTATGTLVVDADQPGGIMGSVIYVPASEVQQSITVNAPATSGYSVGETFISSTVTQIGTISFNGVGSGWDPSQSPLSGSFVIGADGSVILGGGYSGSNVLQIVPSTQAETALSTAQSNVTATGMDNNSSIFFAAYGWNYTIYKIPFNATSKSYTPITSAPSAVCKGAALDTAACVLPTNSVGGVTAFAFDASNNMIYATSTVGTTINSIVLCSQACQYGSTPAVTLYSDGATTLGGLTVDPWGNIFFVDGSNAGSGVSSLKELPVSTSTATGYAAAPVTLLTYTNAQAWNNSLSGLASDAFGTIYFATNADGIFALPNSLSSGPSLSGIVQVSTLGGKAIAIDPQGNLYQIPYNNGDVVDQILIDNITLPTNTVLLPATTSSATLLGSGASCSGLNATFSASTADFSGAASGCSTSSGTFTLKGGSSATTLSAVNVPLTVSFAPITGGTRNATLSVFNGSSTPVGSIALTGKAIAAPVVATPQFSLAGGSYQGVQQVSITDSTAGATIYYTTDGSAPWTGTAAGATAKVFSSSSTPINIGTGSTTINAIAVESLYMPSAVATATYVVTEQTLPTPTFSVAAGNYATTQSVKLSDANTAASIYYTLDGSTPTAKSTLYSGAISVTTSTTINAIAIENGFINSAVATATYTFPTTAPTFSVAAGTVEPNTPLQLADAMMGAVIYYTTDGSTPTSQSAVYTGALTIAASETVKAIAIAPNFYASAVVSEAFYVPPPVFTIALGASSMNVSGNLASTSVTVTSLHLFNAKVTFSCSGLPSGASCIFNPSTLTPAADSTATTSVSITLAALSAANHPPSNPFFPGATLAVAFCLLGWKKRRSLQWALLLAIGAIGLSCFTACGGSSAAVPAAQNSTITITGTSGTITSTATLALTQQ